MTGKKFPVPFQNSHIAPERRPGLMFKSISPDGIRRGLLHERFQDPERKSFRIHNFFGNRIHEIGKVRNEHRTQVDQEPVVTVDKADITAQPSGQVSELQGPFRRAGFNATDVDLVS